MLIVSLFVLRISMIAKSLMQSCLAYLDGNKEYTMTFQPFDLYMALLMGDHDSIRQVMESGIQLNFRIRNQTPLYIAVVNDSCLETIELLISNGADINATSSTFMARDEPPIVAASRKSFFDVVEFLLKVPDLKVNSCDHSGKGAIYFAVLQNDPKMLNLLFDHNADIHVGTTSQNCPFFHSLSVSGEQIEMMRLLIQHGFSRNRYSRPNKSSVHIIYCAIQAKRRETLELLLQAGFRGNHKENLAFRELCSIWDKEFSDKMWNVLINPLSLKNIALISIRKMLANSYGNVREKYINQLPLPQRLKNDMWLVN